MIWVVSREYGQLPNEEQVNTKDWRTKVNYLEKNPGTVSSQIDYVFKQWWNKVILSGIHPIGQMGVDGSSKIEDLNMCWTCTPIHVVDAPKCDENEDSEIVQFIDKHKMPDQAKYHEIRNLLKRV